MFKIKRIYEAKENTDGFRVLVDRLWPRGVSKEKAGIELWLKEIGPSDDLRKWFGHEVEKWEEFEKRYSQELKGKEDLLGQLKKIERENKTVTLVYSAKDTEHNQAVVLKNYLEKPSGKQDLF